MAEAILDDPPDRAAIAIVPLVTAATALGRRLVWSRRDKPAKAT